MIEGWNLVPDEIRVMEEEWDYLIILDACRYDYFEGLNFYEGALEKRISLGSNTCEWVENNFTSYYDDVAYISGNPWVSVTWMEEQLENGAPFPYIDRVWDYGYDMDLYTVPPEKITEAALRGVKKFPGYRMIIHYLQPHYPFINYFDDMEKIVKLSKREGKEIWDLLIDGTIDSEVVQVAYAKNLELILQAIWDLIKRLKGRIVISSDHGNCFGEYGIYGHPGGKHVKPLVEVPWFRLTEDARLTVGERTRLPSRGRL